ncbi:MAG: divergent PAP2 family protein [Candidatus Woesearchaeota archaeon]
MIIGSENYTTIIFYSVIITAIISQLIKFTTESIIAKKALYKVLARNGGMPSTHSALVSSLSSSIFIFEGLSTGFIISLVFGIIVIVDAMGVRREAGEEATLINKIMKKEHMRAKSLNELMGHTPLQVVTGIALGIIISLIISL